MRWRISRRRTRSFFFNDTATTEIYTLSLHDALPISSQVLMLSENTTSRMPLHSCSELKRSEEHTSELQSPDHLVCRLLLEKNCLRRCNHGGTALGGRPDDRSGEAERARRQAGTPAHEGRSIDHRRHHRPDRRPAD